MTMELIAFILFVLVFPVIFCFGAIGATGPGLNLRKYTEEDDYEVLKKSEQMGILDEKGKRYLKYLERKLGKDN